MQINKGQFRLSSRKKNIKFELNRGKGHLLSYLQNRIQWHLNPRIHHVSKYPLHVDIEISSACNLHCSMCYTITDEFKSKVEIGLMDFELFKKIVDECAENKVYSIRISLRGEAFLHPNVYEMIEYAKKKGVKEVSSLTHGGMITEEKFEKLIEIGLDWLTISFDGIGETYEKIRHPLKFDDMVQKIKNFKEIKKRKGVTKPVIKIQTVWPAISKNPTEFYNIFNSITDQIASNPLIDYLRKDEDIIYEKNFTCPQLWERLVISSNGEALLCANDEMGQVKIGNANEQSIYEIWHGTKINQARKIHLKHEGAQKIAPCKHCYLPRKTENETSQIGNRLIKIDNYINREQEIGK